MIFIVTKPLMAQDVKPRVSRMDEHQFIHIGDHLIARAPDGKEFDAIALSEDFEGDRELVERVWGRNSGNMDKIVAKMTVYRFPEPDPTTVELPSIPDV